MVVGGGELGTVGATDPFGVTGGSLSMVGAMEGLDAPEFVIVTLAQGLTAGIVRGGGGFEGGGGID